MKLLIVARKSLREALREPQLLLLTLLLPLIFLLIAKVSYSAPLQSTHSLLVLDETDVARPLLLDLSALRYENGTAVFDIHPVSSVEEAEGMLKAQTAVLFLLVKNSCSEQGALSNPYQNQCVTLTVEGDALALSYYEASTILDNAITTFFDTVQGQSALVDIVTEPVTAVTPKTEFDLYAPGMMIFAWLMLTPQTAMLVAREIRRGTLQRLRLTPMHGWDYLGGVTLAQLIVAIVQVIIVLFAARWMGFQGSGSLWQSGVVGIGVSMGAIGMGLVVANFVQNDSQAANLGSTISMIQVFLSGAFYALPPITIGTIAGHQMDLFDIFPATSGLLALQQLLTFGASLSDVVFRLGWVGVVTAVYFIVGVWLFQNNQTKVN